jgi:hypothetical protein
MMFLNALLLGGMAAAAIPLIIHLLNRTRFKVLDWGAMHLLESALQVNSRRMQWQSWLLLALRMAIPALLALCLARPVLTAWRTATGGNQHSVVFVIDNSLSMQAACKDSAATGTSSGKSSAASNSCLDAALNQAAALLERFGPSTEITVLTSGGGVLDQTGGATFDSQRVLRRLRDIEGGAGASAVAETLTAALSQLSTATQPRRHVIWFSDFQRNDWEGLAPDQLAALRERGTTTGPATEITLVPIVARQTENLSVTIDRPAGPSVVAHQQPVEVRAAIRNHGRTRIQGLPVVLAADGVSLASKSVDIAPDSQVFLVFTCQLQSLGSHVLTVAIDEAAARQQAGEDTHALVTSDDVARWSVEVIEPVRVGIVSPRAAGSKTIDDALFINLALSPYAASLEQGAMSEETAGWAEAHAGADPIRCEVASPNEVTERWLGSLRVVVLANVASLEPAATKGLTSWVQAGGALMICAGEGLQPNWYNQQWGPTSTTPLLPADYGALIRPADRKAAPLQIQMQSYEHPALALFNRSSNGRLDSIDFRTWYRLNTHQAPDSQVDATKEATTESRKSLTLLALENGDPLLIEQSVGRGRVLQWATSCGDRWSNLPLREVFLPLMQQLVISSATAAMPPLNLTTGQPLAIRWYAKDALAGATQSASESSATSVNLLTPQGLRYRLDVQSAGDERSVQFLRTQFPGIYRLDGTLGTAAEQALAVAINPTPEESVLAPLSTAALEGLPARTCAHRRPASGHGWRSGAELRSQQSSTRRGAI